MFSVNLLASKFYFRNKHQTATVSQYYTKKQTIILLIVTLNNRSQLQRFKNDNCNCTHLILPGVFQLGSVRHQPVVMPPRHWSRRNPEDGASKRDVSARNDFDDWNVLRGRVLACDVTMREVRRFLDWKLWGRREAEGVGGGRGGRGSDLRQTSQLSEVERSECAILNNKKEEKKCFKSDSENRWQTNGYNGLLGKRMVWIIFMEMTWIVCVEMYRIANDTLNGDGRLRSGSCWDSS
jgi:hypothetical protein